MTPKQQKLLLYIAANMAGDVPPTYEAMAAHMGVASKGNISRLIDSLEQQGYLRRNRNGNGNVLARSLSIVKVPQAEPAAEVLKHYTQRVITAVALRTPMSRGGLLDLEKEVSAILQAYRAAR